MNEAVSARYWEKARTEGQPLGANEQLYKADLSGTAAAVSPTYSFANW